MKRRERNDLNRGRNLMPGKIIKIQNKVKHGRGNSDKERMRTNGMMNNNKYEERNVRYSLGERWGMHHAAGRHGAHLYSLGLPACGVVSLQSWNTGLICVQFP